MVWRRVGICGPHVSRLGATLNPTTNPLASLTRGFVRAIDWCLRRFYRVKPFTDDPGCILRLSPGRSQRDLCLSDGKRVRVGDPVLDIHLWNERLPSLSQVSWMVDWTRFLLHGFRISLALLAEYLSYHSATGREVVLRGEMGAASDFQTAKNIFERLGFDVVLKENPGSRIWRRAFWDALYSYALMWTFCAPSVRGKRLTKLLRVQVWMSEETLRQRYGKRDKDDGFVVSEISNDERPGLEV
jgi:hypothetical protein